MTAYAADLHWSAALAYTIAALLLLFGCGFLVRQERSFSGLCLLMAAMGLAVGATLFTHNATALPEIGLILLAAGAGGIALARHGALSALPPGLAGLAIVFLAVMIVRDPAAFTIGGPDIMVTLSGRMELGLSAGLGGMAFFGAVGMLFVSDEESATRHQAWLGGLSGCGAAFMGLGLQNDAIMVAGALAASLCTTLAWRMRAPR